MNHTEHDLPSHDGCHDDSSNNTSIQYHQRPCAARSPDSDTSSSVSSVFDDGDAKSSQASPIASPPLQSERAWKRERSPTRNGCQAVTAASRVAVDGGVFVRPQFQKRPQAQTQRTSINIKQLVNEEPWPAAPCRPSTNPRRTSSTSLVQKSVVCQTSNRCPPQLTRQSDRTQNFVENLVDTSTQMIEVIWPLSVAHCDKSHLGGNNLIGLRIFIQEVLKRSKTSYYTLQVALYYLVLIKPHVPKADFTKPQTEFTHAQRAMQCGRRMFLAALILASKYLQDRNYSARAWSKISGLKIDEINSNEKIFVSAVDYRLHIPEPKFQRWANIVFKYSTSASASTYPSVKTSSVTPWRCIIPRLTPDLDEVDIEQYSRAIFINSNPPKHLASSSLLSRLPPPPPSSSPSSLAAPVWADFRPQFDVDKTPTLATINQFELTDSSCPPFSPRLPALPTPVMTPRMAGYQVPTAAKTWCQGQAMRETMQKIQQECLKKSASESWPGEDSLQQQQRSTKHLSRVISNVSLMSSPESMVSDHSSNSSSSRTSRSSSIGSVSIPTLGARSGNSQSINPSANHRSALAGLNGCNYAPACIKQSAEQFVPFLDGYSGNAEMDATLALMNLAKTNKWDNTNSDGNKQENRQKRTRPISVDFGDAVSEEVRFLLSRAAGSDANDSEVLTDARQSNSVALTHAKLIQRYIQNGTSLSAENSQAGARKKTKGSSLRGPWAASSPKVICLR